ncbi:hypothetical protein KIW84_040294 [Lathyrus oleraceus]|uniref:Translation initiation factor 3 N-terminal domain-containing protein n=1 Tax=Pisum sativum TaxID=3888 RepID=A0A9D5AJX1_PEA|nr:hypothetical protein KIW84_040294 [Pisum sativum]
MSGITTTTVPVKLKLFDTRISPLFSSSIPHSLSFHYSPSHATVRYGVSLRTSAYGNNFRRPPPSNEADNEEALDLSKIRSGTVRLIDQSQNMIGVVSLDKAIQMAEDAELDLVIVSAEADPPVVRIMNYRYNIDQHDYSVRLKAARKFLADGDKVKIIVNLKGREKEFRNNAIELIRRFQDDVGKLGTEEAKNFRDKNIFITLVPNKVEVQKPQETPKIAAADEVSVSVEA